MSYKYDEWFVSSVNEIFLAITDDKNAVPQKLQAFVNGLNYCRSQLGELNPLLLEIGEKIIPPIQSKMGTKFAPPSTISTPIVPGEASFNVDELREKLEKRKKKKVFSELKGGIDELRGTE